MSQKSTIMIKKMYYQIAIVTLLSTLFWTGWEIYKAWTKDEEVTIDSKVIAPIDTKINKEIIDSLKTRINTEDLMVTPEATNSSEVNNL